MATTKKAPAKVRSTKSTVSELKARIEELKEKNEFLTTNLNNVDLFLSDLISQVDEKARPTRRMFGWKWGIRSWKEIRNRLQVLVNVAKQQQAAATQSKESQAKSAE